MSSVPKSMYGLFPVLMSNMCARLSYHWNYFISKQLLAHNKPDELEAVRAVVRK